MTYDLFRAQIKCACGYEHLTVQTDRAMTAWAGLKLLKIHQAGCEQKAELIMDNNEREEDRP